MWSDDEAAAILTLPPVAPPLPTAPSLLGFEEVDSLTDLGAELLPLHRPPPPPPAAAAASATAGVAGSRRKSPLRSHTPIALCEASFTTTESDRRQSAASADARRGGGGRPRRVSHASSSGSGSGSDDSAGSSASSSSSDSAASSELASTPDSSQGCTRPAHRDSASVAATNASAASDEAADATGQPCSTTAGLPPLPATDFALGARSRRPSTAEGGAAASRRLPKGRVFVSRAGARGPKLLTETPHAAADTTLPMVASRNVSAHLLRRVTSSRHGRRLMPSVSSSLRSPGAPALGTLAPAAGVTLRSGAPLPDPAGVDALAKVYEGAIMQMAAHAAAGVGPPPPPPSRWRRWAGRGHRGDAARPPRTPAEEAVAAAAAASRARRDRPTPATAGGGLGGAAWAASAAGAAARNRDLATCAESAPAPADCTVDCRAADDPGAPVDFAMDDFITFISTANAPSRTPWVLRWSSRSRREARTRAATAAAAAEAPPFKTLSAARSAAAAAAAGRAAASSAEGGDCPGGLGAGEASTSAVKRGLRALGRPFTRRP